MLLLSRKRGEELFIGKGVRVKVLEMRGDRVKLGFIAPAEISIQRKEIQHRAEPLQSALGDAGCT